MKKISKEEAYRIFYMVKGHINISDDTALSCYESYAKRLWYNNEASDKGFKEVYKNKTKKN